MYPYVASSMRKIVDGQCDTFRRRVFPLEETSQPPQPGHPVAITRPPSERITILQPITETQPAQELPFEEFARSIPLHAIPVSRIESLTAEEIEKCRSFIRDQKFEYWPACVLTLGLRGESSDNRLLQAILDNPDPSEIVALAKTNVGLARAWLAAETKDQAILATLTSLQYPQNNLRFFKGPNAELDARELARKAAIGATALTDSDLARAALAAQENASSGGAIDLKVSPEFWRGIAETKQKIENKGLKGFLWDQERAIRGVQ